MTIIFFDTETTGLPNWHEPSGGESQPHIVSIAAQLCEDDGKTVSHLHLIVNPDGWVIPQEAADVHGMDTDFATRYGVDEWAAVQMFLMLAELADTKIAHGLSFDNRLIRIALKRYGWDTYADETWKTAPGFCTMQKSTKLVNLPPTDKMMAAGRKTPKSPTMGEAYEFFTGKPLENAHTAWADMVACKAVYFAITEREAAA